MKRTRDNGDTEISLDAANGAYYIGFANVTPRAVAKTKQVSENPLILVDYNEKGKVLGVEIIKMTVVQAELIDGLKEALEHTRGNLKLKITKVKS
jgi:uncharacterized protein YuzE